MKSPLSQSPDRAMKLKLTYIVTLLLLAFVLLIGRKLYVTSVVDADDFRTRANSQQLDSFTINANRGTIYDRNGKIMAQSRTVWNVILSPYDVKLNENNPEEIAEMLSEVLGLDYDKMMKLMNEPERRYEVVARRIERKEHDKIVKWKAEKEIALYAVYLMEDTLRHYPNDKSASNVIGFTNYENDGMYGIESFYDDQLQGLDGRLVMLRDAVGRTMANEYENRFDATDGNNVYMTVDVSLQHYLEKHLEAAVHQHNVANRATGIMMNPNTGAILAMATTLGYNLNEPTELTEAQEQQLKEIEDKLTNEAKLQGEITKKVKKSIDGKVAKERSAMWEQQWRNKAITELYFPGSVFKVVTAAMALEEKEITPQTSYSCHNQYVEVAGTRIHCWAYGRSGHDPANLTLAMRHSCNPAFINIGSRLGTQRFYDYLDAFGLTDKTGIDLPAEAGSIVANRERMSSVDLAMSSIGQTNKITPLQMITAYAACINGGYLVQPHMVDRITDNDGNVIQDNLGGVRRQILSAETSAIMRETLEEVVKANGGTNAYISGYRIGGKSGTSEKIDESTPGNMRYVSSFAAFAPADNPQVIMLVVVDDARGEQYYGSQVAAPVVSAVFRESFPHLEIFPQYTAEEQALQDTLMPNLIGRSELEMISDLNRAGLLEPPNIEGTGKRVVHTVPEAGAPLGRASTVVVYFDDDSYQNAIDAVVPDVHGMSVTQANKALTDAGLNIRFMGGAVANVNARAMSMSVQPGEMLPKGTIVEVHFIVDEGRGG
ncbi:MAG: penicillin-binding transpeptidase domain-containing protein [Oscillospiraceae bacterium]|nr:penicillin-binding transpeptidase domain-containing protein [Oscillospiraceae bacterium]